MPSLYLLFGQAVRRLRVEAGYSQESFADTIGVHRNYIGTVERGETNITLENISRIARGLKRPIWMLLRDMETTKTESGNDIVPLVAPREVQPQEARPARTGRVAERRVEVREQVAELLAELNRLEAAGDKKVSRPQKRRGKK